MSVVRWVVSVAKLLVDGPHREFELGDLDESLRRTLRERGPSAVLREGVLVLLRLVLRRGSVVIAELAGDLRLAVRQFVRVPRVFFGGAAILAVGLGAGVFSWGVPYGMFGRGLEVEHPDRFAVFGATIPFRSDGPFATQTRWGVQLSDRGLLDGLVGLEMVGLWTQGTVNWVDGVAPAARVSSTTGSPAILSELEYEAEVGRLLVPSDTAASASAVVVLSHALWTTRFGGDPGVVGRVVGINGTSTEIVGVLPPGTGFPMPTGVWLPHSVRTLPPAAELRVIGRMLEGATPAGVAAQLQARLDALPADRSEGWEGAIAFGRPFTEGFRTDPNTRQLRLITHSGILLMIMALANVGNLFLVHAQTRTRELAVRRAVGAGRMRILRQLAAETTLPAILGILGGGAIAAYGLAFYTASWDTPYVWWVWKIEAPHFLFLGVAAVLSTVVVTLLVGVHELGRGGAASLRSSRGSQGRRFRLGYALVGVEVAVGSALLLVAVLMVRSGWKLYSTEWSFATESVVTGRVVLEGETYQTPEARSAFWRELQSELDAEPGVIAATLTSQLPFIRAGGLRYIQIEGQSVEEWQNLPRRYGTAATPSFFETFDVSLVSGRTFGSADSRDGQPVVIVNTDFVDTHLSGGEIMGRRLRIWSEYRSRREHERE